MRARITILTGQEPMQQANRFCVLMVHGTFSGDHGRIKNILKQNNSGAEVEGEDAGEESSRWYDDDDAFWLDRYPQLRDHTDRNNFFEEIKGKHYKIIPSYFTHEVFDQYAREHDSAYFTDLWRDMRELQDRNVNLRSNDDPFFRYPGIERMDCVSRALSLLKSSDNERDVQILTRAVRWPARGSFFPSFPFGKFASFSGANSEYARTKAAEQLFKEMEHLEKAKIPFVVIGHSHGGSIAIEALRKFPKVLAKFSTLKGVLTVGAPFVRIRRSFLDQCLAVVGPRYRTLFLGVAMVAVGVFAAKTSILQLIGVAIGLGLLVLLFDIIQKETDKHSWKKFHDRRTNKLKMFRHRRDEVINAFENLLNEAPSGSDRAEEPQSTESRGVDRLSALATRFASPVVGLFLLGRYLGAVAKAFVIVFFLFGLGTILQNELNVSFGDLGAGSFLERAKVGECTGSNLPSCDAISRAIVALGVAVGISSLSGLIELAYKAVSSWREIRISVSSAVQKLFTIGLLGMRKNNRNVQEIGIDARAFDMPSDVEEALDAVQFSQIDGFSRLFSKLPTMAVESARGKLTAWPKLGNEIMSNKAIMHNAYFSSETFLLYITHHIERLASDAVQTNALFFDLAEFASFHRDISGLKNITRSKNPREGIEPEIDREIDVFNRTPYPFDPRREGTWFGDSRQPNHNEDSLQVPREDEITRTSFR